jgi:hypothetical protein
MKTNNRQIEALESRIAPAFSGTFNLGAFIAPTFDGGAANDSSGFSVADAGDVNGDGMGDFIIGAPFASSGAGEAYVVFGKDGNLPVDTNLANLNGTNGFRIEGSISGANLGRSVAGVGDVNGDGFDDVVVGAPLANINGNSASGISYIVFGGASPDAAVTTNTINGTNGFALFGNATGDLVGISVGGAGDVNNDGFSDVIIGASGYDVPNMGGGIDADKGGAAVLYGHAGSFVSFNSFNQIGSGNANPGFRITGQNAGDDAGSAVSSAGDFNGDGFDDILIGASTAKPPGGGSSTGAAYVVYGGKTIDSNITLGTAKGLKINGIASGDSLGDAVALAGDVNNDGFSDILIGASGNDANGNNSGEAYVVYGGKNLGSSMSAADADIRLQGIGNNTLAGTSVSSAGDFNGDGFSDLLIGGTSANVAPGQAFVVFGRPDGFTAPVDLSALDGTNGIKIVGETTGDDLGFSVAGGTDINNDGYDDLLLGAFNAKAGNKTDAGMSYVIYGSNGNNQVTIGADGKTASYTDVDGDLVTVKVNKGTLEANDFVLSGANYLGGATLQKINFNGDTDLEGANVKITAVPQSINGVLMGDGLANVGNFDASGVSFKKVNVAGDVGKLTTSGAKSITLNSFGAQGTSTQLGTDADLLSLIGGAPNLTVKTDISGITYVGAQVGKVKVGGDIESSKFFLSGGPDPTSQKDSVSLKKLTVGGNLDNSSVLAGYSIFNGSADVSVGKVTVGGDWMASTVVAGVAAGDDGVLGTADDKLFDGGSDNIISRIASVMIKGNATGSPEAGGRFTISAEQVGSVTVGGIKQKLNPLATDKLLAIGSTGDFFVNEV